jgi:hypothetical protein
MMQTTLSDRCRLADEIASKVRHSLNLSDFDGRSVALLALVALEGDKAFPSDLTAPVAWVDE